MALQVSITSEANQAELEPIFNDFIKELEENKLSFKGGLNENDIEGVLDFSSSGRSRAQVVELLETFVLMNDIFSGLNYQNV